MAFFKYTGPDFTEYPQLDILARLNKVYDFGATTPPADGRFVSDPGPATATTRAGTPVTAPVITPPPSYVLTSDLPSLALSPSTAAVTYDTVVKHGATAGTARPAGATQVLWIGTVTPTNASGSDLYLNGTTLSVFSGSAFMTISGSDVNALYFAGAPLTVYGDSYTNDPGVYATSAQVAHRLLAATLGLGTISNYGVGGYEMADTAARVAGGLGQDADGNTIPTAGAWAGTETGVVLIDAGKNNNLYTGAADQRTFNAVQHGLRAILAYIACGVRLSAQDPSITYGGAGTTWVVGSGNERASGTIRNTATVTIALPSAGDWYLFDQILDDTAAAVSSNTSYSVTVGGVAQPAWLLPQVKRSRSLQTAFCQTAYKVTTTGPATVVLTAQGSAGTNFAAFSGYAKVRSAPPLALVRAQNIFANYGYGGTGGGGGTDAGVTQVDANISSVVAEFPNAVLSDARASWTTALLGADGLHPLPTGQTVLYNADLAITKGTLRSRLGKALGVSLPAGP